MNELEIIECVCALIVCLVTGATLFMIYRW